MNGGYIMVDLTGWITGHESVVPGAYNALDTALETGKPIFLSGVAYSEGKIMSPFCAEVFREGGNITIGIGAEGTTYQVDENDTFNN